MLEITVKSSWPHEKTKTMDLDTALTPEAYTDSESDFAVEQATLNAQVIGKILAALVEKTVFTLDEAIEFCGRGHQVISDDNED